MYPQKKKQRPAFLSGSTTIGLKVTLQGTLELLDYLTKERQYTYLMTARLNQDNLEVSQRSNFSFQFHFYSPAYAWLYHH